MVMLSVSYAGKNAYSAGKTSGVLRGGTLGVPSLFLSPTHRPSKIEYGLQILSGV